MSDGPPAIPLADIARQMAGVLAEVEPEMRAVLASGPFILGPRGRAFETEAADFLGVRRAVGVGSGSDALHLALRAAGIGPGDGVIIPPFAGAAVAEAVLGAGATPLFADIDPYTLHLDPEAAEAAVTPATRALLPVHLFGQPVAMAAFDDIAERHGLSVIEDAGHSFGAGRGGRMTGSWGRAGAFSLAPGRNLGGAGDGGLITTDDDELADHLMRLRDHGAGRGGQHEEPGFNSRLDELQAVVLRAKLRHIRAYNEGRRRVAMGYRRILAEAAVHLPNEAAEGAHVYNRFVIQASNRDEVRAALAAADIASAAPYAVPLHRQPAFAPYARSARCPVADRVAQRVLALPTFPELTKEEVERIAAVVERVARP